MNITQRHLQFQFFYIEVPHFFTFSTQYRWDVTPSLQLNPSLFYLAYSGYASLQPGLNIKINETLFFGVNAKIHNWRGNVDRFGLLIGGEMANHFQIVLSYDNLVKNFLATGYGFLELGLSFVWEKTDRGPVKKEWIDIPGY